MLLDRQGLRWFWGLTCVFWAENAKRKIGATARSIESITFWPRWRWFITWPVGATGSKVRFAHYPPAIGEGQNRGRGIPDQRTDYQPVPYQRRWSAVYRCRALPLVTGGRYKSAQHPRKQLRKDNRRGIFPIRSHDLQADGQAALAMPDRGNRGRTSCQRSGRDPTQHIAVVTRAVHRRNFALVLRFAVVMLKRRGEGHG